MRDIRWLCNLRAVCWCRGEVLNVRKLPLRQSAGVVCCPLPIFKPSLGRWEIYPSVLSHSFLEKGASSVLLSYFRLGGLPGLKIKDLTQQELMMTSRTRYISKKKSLKNVEYVILSGFFCVCSLAINLLQK